MLDYNLKKNGQYIAQQRISGYGFYTKTPPTLLLSVATSDIRKRYLLIGDSTRKPLGGEYSER
jgi:hypothetical protein